MHKKLISLLLVLTVVLVPLSACGGGAATPQTPPSASQPGTGSAPSGRVSYKDFTWPDIIPVYSQSAGQAYVINGAIVDMATKYMPGVTFVSEGTSGAMEVITLMEERAQAGRAAISVLAADGVYMARLGLGVYETPCTEVYHTSFIFPNDIWLTTPRKSGIKTMADVVGKRVAIGNVGSAIAVLSEVYLEAYGVTLDDFHPFYMNYEGANSGMQDGSLDGGFYGGPPPFSVYEDLASSMDITAVGISQEKADEILLKYPYYIQQTYPAGIMAGVDEELRVLCLANIINMNSQISNDLAYAILDMLFDNLEEFREYAPRALADFSLENWDWAVCSDIHPGAIEFFIDKGVYNR